MGSGRAIEIAPFHSRGSLKGFVISGRWPDSTKEWAQLLMVAVRVASLPGLLSTTTIFGAREELPDEPEPNTVGLVARRGHGRRRISGSAWIFRRASAAGPVDVAPTVGDHTDTARVLGCGVGMCTAARPAASRSGTPCRMGGSGGRRHGDVDGEPRRTRSDQSSRHRDTGHAPCRIRVFEATDSFRFGAPERSIRVPEIVLPAGVSAQTPLSSI